MDTIATNGGVDMILVAHDKFTEGSEIPGAGPDGGPLYHVQSASGRQTGTTDGENPYSVYLHIAREMLFVEIAGGRLTGEIRDQSGNVEYTFQIDKGPPPTTLPLAPTALDVY